MRKLALQQMYGITPQKAALQLPTDADVFLASVINQKTINQNAQQVLAIIAAQVLNILEAQFGFSTNDDSDDIST